jgi:diguanylate cyclase (GGDEF)-like protein
MAELHKMNKKPVVLVVDDDAAMRLLIMSALDRDDYIMTEAENGVHALETISKRRPDIVLMDAVMPEMNGFDACAKIRKLSDGPAIPVLLLTGLDDDSSVELAFECGAKDFIPKPIHWAVLRQRVRRILDASKVERDIVHLAYHDFLTGLPSRRMLLDRFGSAIARGKRCGRRVATLFVDLDNFKMINDTLGHDTGDAMLQVVADRLSKSLRESDTVARLGGDEFSLLLENIGTVDDVKIVAESVLQTLNQPIQLPDREVVVTPSIGIAIYPDDGDDIRTLMKNADTAMYRAKDAGRNGYAFYAAEMGATAMRRLLIESSLRRALEQEEFFLHYQPRVDFASGKVISVEALMRWKHPELGLISPTEFIPIAEETGLIVPIGEWALRQACEAVVRWAQRGLEGVMVSVNLSARQLKDPGLANKMRAVLEGTGCSPSLLELELTETTTMVDPQTTIQVLRELQNLGIRLSIDDFGTGYSCLSYLKRFSINGLKIDRSFVDGIPDDADDVALVQTIIAVARSLRLAVVAEGVERPEQAEFLAGYGCEEMQGFLFSRALPESEFCKWADSRIDTGGQSNGSAISA